MKYSRNLVREVDQLFDCINKLKSQLDASRPLPKHTLTSLQEKLSLEWTYHSNAIEGNTLTMNETKVVLEGITIGGKTLREHLEVINHRDAIIYVENVIEEEQLLSEWQIKNIHRLVLRGINDTFAGVYRTEQVFISGAKHVPPAHYLIQEKMEKMMDWYFSDGIQLHPIERGAMLHAILVGIHPFIDGNGRTARLLLNLELMKSGFPPVIIKVENRLAYYEALDKANTDANYEDFIKLVTKEVEYSLNLYLSAIS